MRTGDCDRVASIRSMQFQTMALNAASTLSTLGRLQGSAALAACAGLDGQALSAQRSVTGAVGMPLELSAAGLNFNGCCDPLVSSRDRMAGPLICTIRARGPRVEVTRIGLS